MLTEFQEIIQKNLPAQVGEALRVRLTIADYADEEIPKLKEQVEKLKVTVQDQQKKIISQNEIEAKLELQKTQEQTLVQERRNLEVEKLKIELEAEKDKSGFAKSVALGLVRNIEYRRNLLDLQSGNTGEKDQYGSQMYRNITQNTTETRTAE